MSKPKDFPFDDVAASCDAMVKLGNFIQQKWTCEACNKRLYADNLNTFVEEGKCECGHVTNLRKRGCNFAMIIPSHKDMTVADMERAMGLAAPGLH
jgi:hypothetical protein